MLSKTKKSLKLEVNHSEIDSERFALSLEHRSSLMCQSETREFPLLEAFLFTFFLSK